MENTPELSTESSFDNKKKILQYIIFIVCLIAAFYLVEIVRFLKPLFDLIWFGNIVPLCTNVARIILYIGIIIAAFFVGKKYFPGVQFKQRGEEYSLKRLLLIYGITVGIVFIVTACLNFKIKIVHDLGENIAGPTASNNFSYMLAGFFQMPIYILVIRYSQELFNLIFKKDVMKYIPFGGLISLVAFGIFEMLTAGVSAISIVFLFMHLVYGMMYILTKKNYTMTYIVCMVIYLL